MLPLPESRSSTATINWDSFNSAIRTRWQSAKISLQFNCSIAREEMAYRQQGDNNNAMGKLKWKNPLSRRAMRSSIRPRIDVGMTLTTPEGRDRLCGSKTFAYSLLTKMITHAFYPHKTSQSLHHHDHHHHRHQISTSIDRFQRVNSLQHSITLHSWHTSTFMAYPSI